MEKKSWIPITNWCLNSEYLIGAFPFRVNFSVIIIVIIVIFFGNLWQIKSCRRDTAYQTLIMPVCLHLHKTDHLTNFRTDWCIQPNLEYGSTQVNFFHKTTLCSLIHKAGCIFHALGVCIIGWAFFCWVLYTANIYRERELLHIFNTKIKRTVL